MICPLSLQNFLEWNVYMWSKWDSLNSPETYTIALTEEKKSFSNAKDNQNGRKKMIVIRLFKKLYWEKFIFLASLFRFMLLIFCKRCSEIAVTDSIRADFCRFWLGSSRSYIVKWNKFHNHSHNMVTKSIRCKNRFRTPSIRKMWILS